MGHLSALRKSSSKRLEAVGVLPDLNVTPLVDVVLVLLIIFMVVAPALEHGERVELPSATSPDPEPKGKLDPITLTLGTSGTIFLERDKTVQSALPAALSALHARFPERRVVLRADANAPFEGIGHVFQAVQNAGFTGCSLVISKKEERGH